MIAAEGGRCRATGWLTPLAFLYSVAMQTGIGVRDYPGDPHADGTAAIVTDGNAIALNSGLADDGLRADVLAMALEVATVMTDRPRSRPGAIYAPGGFVVITGNRVPVPAEGVGKFATFMARKSGRDTTSAAFEYYISGFEFQHPQARRRALACRLTCLFSLGFEGAFSSDGFPGVVRGAGRRFLDPV